MNKYKEALESTKDFVQKHCDRPVGEQLEAIYNIGFKDGYKEAQEMLVPSEKTRLKYEEDLKELEHRHRKVVVTNRKLNSDYQRAKLKTIELQRTIDRILEETEEK